MNNTTASRYILVQRKEGVSLATKWIDDADHFGLGPNVLVEIDFEAFIDGAPTNAAYAAIRARNAHLIG